MKLFLDTETTGLNIFDKDKVFGISLALDAQIPEYIDLREESPRRLLEALDKADEVICHGTKFDSHALRDTVDLTKYNLDCTIVRAQLLDEHKLQYDLESLTGQKLDIIDQLADMFGGQATKNVQMQNLHKAPKDFAEKYAIQDIYALRNLYYDQAKHEMPEVHALEKQVLKTLIRTEQKGMLVDMYAVEKACKDMEKAINAAEAALLGVTVTRLNPNSPKQLADFFCARKGQKRVKEGDRHVAIDGTLISPTGSGAPSFNAENLGKMTHPAAGLILKVRKYRKILDTFLVSQIMGNNVNGRVHPWFNQTRVVTGRLSCSNPNMQAVPKRDPEMKRILRPLFLPEPGYTLLRCDYEQSDVRGFAHYISSASNQDDHPVLQAYKENPMTDFHSFVADMMGIQRNPGKTGEPNAKQINLAMIFNMGMGTLAKEMGLPYTEHANPRTGKVYLTAGPDAESIFNLYHGKIPGATDMGQTASAIAASRGYVKSIAGRHLRFPKRLAWSTYKASGYLYQAFTADLIKMAMVAVEKVVPHLHLSVHDELICSIDDEEQIREAKYVMEHVFDGLTEIPIRTVPEIGQNWGNTEPWEEQND